jgi:hypothetical protein
MAIQCVAELPIRVGRSGLARILLGSVASPIWPRQSLWFGVLDDWTLSRVEDLIEQAVADGYLERGDDQLFMVTAAGYTRAAELARTMAPGETD